MKTSRIILLATASVMTVSLTACGGGSKAAQSIAPLTPTSSTSHAAPPSTSAVSSSSPTSKASSATPSSTTHASHAAICTTAELDKPLQAANLRGVSGQYATVGHNPKCQGDWWIENVYDAGDAMAILHWTNAGWRLVTSNNMTICENQLADQGAPASVISYAKQSGGLAPKCGTPAMASPFGAKSAAPTSPSSPTASQKPSAATPKPGGVATAQGINATFFNNATFTTAYAGTVTFHNGSGMTTGSGASLPAGLPHTANGLAGGPGPVFGDVNHDGIKDAIVQIAVQDGNGVSIEESLWIGSAKGGATQLGKPFLTTGRCGFTITSHKITSDGTIQVSGGGMGQDCASSGTGPAYTAEYKVDNGKLVTVQAPPQ